MSARRWLATRIVRPLSDRGLPLVLSVAGRVSEDLRLPDGAGIPAYAIEAYMAVHVDTRAIREYQVVQTAVDRVLLRLVTTDQAASRNPDALRKGLSSILGPEVTADVTEVDQIPPEPSGKRSAVRIEVPA